MTWQAPGFLGMRIKTALAAGMTGFLAAAGAVVGFQHIAPLAETPTATSTTSTTAAKTPAAARPAAVKHQKPRVKVRWKPCPKDYALQGRVCVKDVVQTRVVNVAAPAPPPAPAPAPAPVQPAGTTVSSSSGYSAPGAGTSPGDDGQSYGDDGGGGDDGSREGGDDAGGGGQSHEPGDDGGGHAGGQGDD